MPRVRRLRCEGSSRLRKGRALGALPLLLASIASIASIAIAAGCGGDPGPIPPPRFSWTGPLGTPIPVRLAGGFYFVVETRIGDQPGPSLIVDTWPESASR